MSILQFPIHKRRPWNGAPLLYVAALAFSLAFCGGSGEPKEEGTAEDASAAAPSVEKYTLTGTVLGLREEDKTAVINHEEIAGWMSAMTMDFPIRDAAEWEKLKVGARIEGTVFVSDDGFYVGEIKVLEEDTE